jgi:hypothetical protein
MKKIIVLILVSTALLLTAQTLQSPIPAGTAALVAWDANSVDDGVQHYNVYFVKDGATNKLAATGSTSVNLNLLPPINGTYQFCVTAVNVNGESLPSTNLFVKYFANKANPPKGLNVR